MEIEKQIEIAVQLARFYGITAAVSMLLNLLVIVFIIRRGVKEGPKSDLYILSLAFVDMVYALGTMFNGMAVSRILDYPPQHPNRHVINLYVAFTQGMTIFCCLLHLISITVDRLIALSFPFQHKLWVTRRRILVSIVLIWCTSGFLSSTQFWWSALIIDWVVVMSTICGSGIFILTYSIVIAVTLKRRRLLPDVASATSSSSAPRQITTTVISTFIVLAFMSCNLPYCVAKLIIRDNSWTILMAFVMYTLLNMNAFFNPFIYIVVGILARIRRQRARSLAASNATLVSTTKRTVQRSPVIMENRL